MVDRVFVLRIWDLGVWTLDFGYLGLDLDFRFWILDFGLLILDFVFWILRLGLRISNLDFGIWISNLSFGFQIWMANLGFGIWGLDCRIRTFKSWDFRLRSDVSDPDLTFQTQIVGIEISGSYL